MARTYLGVWNTYWFETGGGGYDPSGDERGRYKLYYEQNQAQNTTTIYVDHYLHVWAGIPEPQTFTFRNLTSKATINGNQQTITKSSISQRVSFGYNEVFLGTTTHTVQHDAEGKANCQFRGSFTNPEYGTKNCANTWSLPDIPPASSISANVAEQTLGNQITFTITPKEPTYVHVLKYKYGTSSETQFDTNVTTSSTWTPPVSMAQYVTNSNFANAIIYCYSYDGSVSDANYKGVSSTTVKLNIPISLSPSCLLDVTDTNTGTLVEHDKVPSDWGIFVKGHSKLKLEAILDWSNTYGATLSSILLTNVDGEKSSSNPFTSQNFVSSSGDWLTSTCVVVDSRGNSWYFTDDPIGIIVYDYENPSASLKVVRCNNDGTYNANGESAKVTITYAISDLSNNNTKDYELKYRLKGTSAYTTIRDSFFTDYNGTIDIVVNNITFGVGNVYEFVLTVSDFFNSTPAEATLSYSRKPISVKKTKGITFGRHATADGFNVYYDAKFYGLMDYGVIAYDNPNGDNGNITLDYDASDYNHCIILYRTNDTDEPVNSVRVDDPDGKNVMLMGVQPYTSTSRCYLKYKKVTISGTSITNVSYSEIEIRNNVSPALSNNNNIYILKVIFF